MSEAATAVRPAERPPDEGGENWRVSIFPIALFLGPPLGGLMVWVVFAIDYLLSQPFSFPDELVLSALLFLRNVIASVVVMAFCGYVFGGLQAAAAGLLLTFWSDKNGRFSYLKAFLAPMAPGLLVMAIFYKDGLLVLTSLLLGLGVASSLALRFLFRKSFAPAEASH